MIYEASSTPGNSGKVAEREYTEVSANIRHYSGLRFFILSAYIVIAGILMGSVPDRGAAECHQQVPMMLAGTGLIVLLSVAGVLLDWRVETYVRGFKQRAQVLEGVLGYNSWRQFNTAFMIGHGVVVGVYTAVDAYAVVSTLLA